jgi:hypothetical protein
MPWVQKPQYYLSLAPPPKKNNAKGLVEQLKSEFNPQYGLKKKNTH